MTIRIEKLQNALALSFLYFRAHAALQQLRAQNEVRAARGEELLDLSKVQATFEETHQELDKALTALTTEEKKAVGKGWIVVGRC